MPPRDSAEVVGEVCASSPSGIAALVGAALDTPTATGASMSGRCSSGRGRYSLGEVDGGVHLRESRHRAFDQEEDRMPVQAAVPAAEGGDRHRADLELSQYPDEILQPASMSARRERDRQ